MPLNWNYGPHWTPERSKKLCEELILRGGYCRQVAALLAFAQAGKSSNSLGAMARLAYLAAEPMIASRLNQEEYAEFQRTIMKLVSEDDCHNSEGVQPLN